MSKGELHVFEPGLKELLKNYLNEGSITLNTSNDDPTSSIHIISVGTPVDFNGDPNLEAVKKVTRSIAKIKRGRFSYFKINSSS